MDFKKIAEIVVKSQTGPFKYKVEAVGYGYGYSKYPIEFEFTSNYDMDKGDYELEQVQEAAQKNIERRGAFKPGQYKIKSLIKLSNTETRSKWAPSGIRHYGKDFSKDELDAIAMFLAFRNQGNWLLDKNEGIQLLKKYLPNKDHKGLIRELKQVSMKIEDESNLDAINKEIGYWKNKVQTDINALKAWENYEKQVNEEYGN